LREIVQLHSWEPAELPTMKLTPDELKTRRGEISTLERIGALREAGFPRIFEFATSICSDAVWFERD
jgi:hypothetical protein